MPGVLQIEALAQATGLLAMESRPDEVGEKSVTIAFSGLTKDSALRLKNNTQAAATITFPGSQGDMTGTFQLTGYNETGNYKEAIEFSAELQSTGAIAIAADA